MSSHSSRSDSGIASNDVVVKARTDVAAALSEISAFVETDEVQALVAEMRSLPPSERPNWVSRVALDPNALAERGVVVPEGKIVQRSTFGDNRPTLFCITKPLPSGKEKVTFTFDND